LRIIKGGDILQFEMKLIIGLGNPGKKYEQTRHNVGWMVVEKLKSEICEVEAGDEKIVLAKPITYMNQSGEAVKRLLQFNNLTIEQCSNDLYVIHDDLDIPLGSFKIQFGKGPKGHKGVESVERALGTKKFWRVRIGIENRQIKQLEQFQQLEHFTGEEYVLGKFTKEEMKVLEKTIPEVVERLMEKVS